MRKLTRFLLGLLGIGVALLFSPSAPTRQRDNAFLANQGVSAKSLQQGHEVGDVRPVGVVYCVIGLFLTIFIIMGLLVGLQRILHYKHSKPAVTQYEKSFRHAPYAETNIAQTWDKINRVTKDLHSYRWIDRQNGVVGIPIERAMQLIAARGLPSREGVTPPFPLPAQEMQPVRQNESPNEITKSF